MHQPVNILVKALFDKAALSYGKRRVLADSVFNETADIRKGVDFVPDKGKLCLFKGCHDRLDGRQHL